MMKRFLPILILFTNTAKAQDCSDTVFKIRYHAPDSIYANDHIITTSQETLILGEIREYPLKKTLLLKLDNKGNKLWSKQYLSSKKLNATKIVQLSDGSFIIGGTAIQSNQALNLFIAKLDEAGNLIWQNFYFFNNNGNLNNIYLQSISEGIGGEILVSWKRGGINFLAGDDHESSVLMLLNANGSIAWSKNFVAEMTKLGGIHLKNGKIIVLGQAYDRSLNCPGNTGGFITAMRLDYVTGNIELQKNFCFEQPGGMTDVEFSTLNHSSVQLDNGNFALSGLYYTVDGGNYCYKILFNEQLDSYFSRRYSTFDPGSVNPTNPLIQVLPSGATVMSHYNIITNKGFYGLIDDHENIMVEKSIAFSPGITPIDFIYNFSIHPYWTFRKRNGKLSIVMNNSVSQKQNIELMIIHNKGDTSVCFGDDAHFISSDQFHFTSTAAVSWKDVFANRVVSVTADMSISPYAIDQDLQCMLIQKPSINIGKDTSLCVGDSIVLSAEEEFLNYTWKPAGFLQLAENTIKVFPQTATQYIVQATTIDGCYVTDTINVGVDPIPTNFIFSDTAICQFDKLQLKPTRSFNHYLWSDGTKNAALDITTAGNYWLQVIDQNGCVGKQNIVVRSRECPVYIYFPNAFTPNNDGKNELFKPVSSGHFLNYNFQIYNRWGQLVFQSQEPGKGWDGKFLGKEQQAGVFVWQCHYQLPGQERKANRGTVMLIK